MPFEVSSKTILLELYSSVVSLGLWSVGLGFRVWDSAGRQMCSCRLLAAVEKTAAPSAKHARHWLLALKIGKSTLRVFCGF